MQKLLSALDEAADPKDDDYYIHSKDQPFHYDVNDPIQRALGTEPILMDVDDVEERVDRADAALLSELADEFADLTPLKKLRLICTKICSSPQRRRAFRLIADEKYGDQMHAPHRRLASLLPVRDVKHRWNYTEAMITRARLLRAALDRWVLDHAELQPLFLLEREWTMLEKLGGVTRDRIYLFDISTAAEFLRDTQSASDSLAEHTINSTCSKSTFHIGLLMSQTLALSHTATTSCDASHPACDVSTGSPERASRSFERVHDHSDLNTTQLRPKVEIAKDGLNTLKLKNLNLEGSVESTHKRLKEYIDLLQFIGQHSHEIPALYRLLANAVVNNWSANVILEHCKLAVEGKYTAQNYTLYEIYLAILIYELGGAGALYAMNHSIFALPSRNTIQPYRSQAKLMPSVNGVRVAVICYNNTHLALAIAKCTLIKKGPTGSKASSISAVARAELDLPDSVYTISGQRADQGLCTGISLLVHYQHRPRFDAAPPPPTLPHTSPKTCARFARSCVPARVCAATPIPSRLAGASTLGAHPVRPTPPPLPHTCASFRIDAGAFLPHTAGWGKVPHRTCTIDVHALDIVARTRALKWRQTDSHTLLIRLSFQAYWPIPMLEARSIDV
ncbi:hypothetical protein B0H14DRAFT_3901181 [Mycena olivaceomarginata]|nr:hypothetical protein B0H14DRAFT_3901181 [Mycena olivaceomarginata]